MELSVGTAVLCMLIQISIDVTDHFLYRHYSRRCGYDCASCRYWPCPVHSCNRKRKEV